MQSMSLHCTHNYEHYRRFLIERNEENRSEKTIFSSLPCRIIRSRLIFGRANSSIRDEHDLVRNVINGIPENGEHGRRVQG